MKRIWTAARTGLCFLVLISPVVWAAPPQVEQALMFVRAACSLPNTSLEMRATPEGRLELRLATADGQRRAVSLVNRDLDNFTDQSAVVIARQPVAQVGCMEPYVHDVISTLLTLPERVAEAPPTASFNPPAMAAPPRPAPAPVPSPAPAPTAVPAVPAAVVSGSPMAQAGGSVVAQRATGAVSFRLSACRAAGRDVVCEVKVSNESGADSRVVVQGAYSKLYGADGSEIQAAWVTMGNQREDMRYGSHQAVLKVIADTSPVMGVVFNRVPEVLNSIKRLELSLGPQTVNGVDMQKLTLADVPIQGR